jgi:hypothetical protein
MDQVSNSIIEEFPEQTSKRESTLAKLARSVLQEPEASPSARELAERVLLLEEFPQS